VRECHTIAAWRVVPVARKKLPVVPQDRCWGPAAGAELQSGEAVALGYKQLQLAEKVYAVYEAGPQGYVH
jgi:hypothetical protein